MKALMLKNLGQVELVDVTIPAIESNELLVKTGAATICTSDVNDIRENPFGIALPVILGHEAAGTVVAIGVEVKNFKIGDRIATHPVHPCGTCQSCLEGLGHLCHNMMHFGLNMPGTFAEYYRVRQDRARLLPNDLDISIAPLTEPVCVCLEALSQAYLEAGQSLLIIGDGPFGIIMSRLAKQFFSGRVVLAGTFDSRMKFAGNIPRINIQEVDDRVAAMRAPLEGYGYDAAILAVGSPQALKDGLNCLKPRGRMVIFSALPGDTLVDLFSLHIKELSIIGSCSDKDYFDEAVQLLSSPELKLSELITHRFTLEQYQQAFHVADHMKAEAMKVAFIL